ncbi:serine/threonine protein kinase [Mycolicibacterium moriokaense]|uniref:non-specific serine/threonine protein kinase n=1 Tax=Mycolicibacterium moriokaense TaxID=39691 RepID=A0AAD1HFZ6_9MYCO|nr:serine/threonine-protein kinase [Mycolicibacterium moriokaense]MCV7038939.1 serine/threonine protein kinase [Mycolicibacterium moriokaense]ORB15293.1 serine/threonine protein kinase [Mycolicibacterium moriokaense]BBX04678.1 protein kinase [Mycolicibacterium moriokaense]
MGSPNGGTRVGTQFGPYELQSLIGVGGMGEVYRAYDTVRERVVAIKLLRTEVAADQSFQQRFRRESRVAARLQEPHVIPVHDFGDIDGVLYIDMRLVEGASLKDELLAKGPLPPARAVSIISQVAAALDAAHANGLVHRDIKPENVLLTPEDFAYLVDFGIAHGGGEASVTSTGLVIGSCAYMAAERFSGARGGPAADVYSLTCLLYECLAGRAPFEAGDVRQMMGAHMFSPPPRPSIMRRGINRGFDDVIAKGMAKQPSERYSTAGELAKAASAALSESTPPPAVPVPPVPPSHTRQFTAVDPNPVRTGYLPPPPSKKSRFGPTQVALVAATIVMFTAAVVLAAVLVFGDRSGGSTPQTRLAVPTSTPAPETTTVTESPSTTTSTTPTTTTSARSEPIAGVSGTDAQGFVGHTARCDPGSTPAAAIRTANSIAVVCESAPGTYYYRGERLRDGANLQLSNATPSGRGFTAVNPADGARYEVQPDMLTILSRTGVDSAEPALEYGSDER